MKRQIVIVLIVLTLALSACGGNVEPSTNIKVTFTDFAFTPNSWLVPAGQEIALEISNEGAVLHEIVIMKLGATIGDDFGDEDKDNIYWRSELGAGETATFSFIAPGDAGEYQVVCGFAGHFVAGMVGSLIVVAP